MYTKIDNKNTKREVNEKGEKFDVYDNASVKIAYLDKVVTKKGYVGSRGYPSDLRFPRLLKENISYLGEDLEPFRFKVSKIN